MEDCQQVNVDVDAGFKLLFQNLLLQVFYDEGIVFRMFVRPQGYKQWVSVTNTRCKQKIVCLQQNSTGHL